MRQRRRARSYRHSVPESLTLFDDAPAPSPATAERPNIEIRVSARRRKWVAAHWEGDTIVVVVPSRTSKRDRAAHAEELAKRLIADRQKRRPSDEDLMRRATDLSRRYLGGRAIPAAVNWSSRQRSRWGSCSSTDRTIRISDLLVEVPSWVVDSVLVHELAHLLHNDHGPEFRAVVAKYPRSAEADAFLTGMEHGLRHSASD